MANSGNPHSSTSYGYWRPIPLGYILEKYGLLNKRTGLLLAFWVFLLGLSFLSVIYWAPADWTSLETTRQAISLVLLFYPPLLICNFLLFWLGFEWAFIPAYLSTFLVALASNMPIEWAVLFGVAVVLGMAIFALVYYSTYFKYTLKKLTDLAFFVGVALVASMASSLGSLIWSHVHELTIEQTLLAWQSWWTGIFLLIVFINAPILFLTGDKIEQIKDKYFDVPVRPKVSLVWVYSSILAVVGVLVIFIISAERLGTLRIEEALVNSSTALASEIIGASQTFELTAWISILILLTAGLGGIRLVDSWNDTLKEQVRIKRSLIAEIHHRVKNNMQLISGLIELQMDNTKNEFVKRELRKSHSRIYSMGKVHEQIYQLEESAHVKMDVYIASVLTKVESNFRETKNISFDLICSPIKLTITQAVTFGLLLNELLTYICKQKLNDTHRAKKISITIEETNDIISTKFQGFFTALDFDGTENLEVLLIKKLATQLNTNFREQTSEDGATLSFSFERKELKSYTAFWLPRTATSTGLEPYPS